MSEWWSYRFSDFLMFSPQVYFRLFETQNREWWPFPVLALVLGIVILVLMRHSSPVATRSAFTLAAVAWVFVGWSFFLRGYAEVHLAGDLVAAAFMLQALLLLWHRVRGGQGVFERTLTERTGIGLAAFALFAWPLLAPLTGRVWWQAEVFGLAPDPTAVATLGLVLAVRKTPWWLLPIPCAWMLFSGATLQSMDQPLSWLGPVAVLLTLVLAAAKPVLRP